MSEWLYLDTKPFQSRVVLAADWLKDCKHVLDVGGYRTPITYYLNPDKHRRIVVIDPRVHDVSLFNMESIKGRWQDHYFEPDASSQGFVCLGIELHAPEEDWPKFIRFIDGCKRAVIGVAVDHIHSRNQFARIEAGLSRLERKFTVSMDLSDNEYSKEGAPPYTNRKLYFFERKQDGKS